MENELNRERESRRAAERQLSAVRPNNSQQRPQILMKKNLHHLYHIHFRGVLVSPSPFKLKPLLFSYTYIHKVFQLIFVVQEVQFSLFHQMKQQEKADYKQI
jgi:hypothetical protein